MPPLRVYAYIIGGGFDGTLKERRAAKRRPG